MRRRAPVLIAAAAPAECRAVMSAFGVAPVPVSPGQSVPLSDRVDLLVTGVGPAPAGITVAAHLARLAVEMAEYRPAVVLDIGVAGSYEGVGPAVLDAVLATRSVFGDHGVDEATGFRGLSAMGFPPAEGDWDRLDPQIESVLIELVQSGGVIATVAACSGRTDQAQAVAERTGAVAEAMEGAAVALACHRFGVPFAELRVISNIVGDRLQHPWRLDEALVAAGRLAKAAAERLEGWPASDK